MKSPLTALTRPLPLVPLLLGSLALFDLRSELRLLADAFTWSALMAAVRSHPLAVAVLALLPSLWQRYGQAIRF